MNEAPSAQAPAQQRDFGPRFDPVPSKGMHIFTVVAFDYIEKYPFKDQKTGVVKPDKALEFTFGSIIDGKTYFVRPFPFRYSIHEKSAYTGLYAAIKGSAPLDGSNPKELLGGGFTMDCEIVSKVSKKGTPYSFTKPVNYTAVHPKLKGEIVSLNALEPAFKAALEASKKTEDAPF